jgi:hypothetical protein
MQELEGTTTPTVIEMDDARSGVTGHNVRYVLGSSLAAVVAGMIVVAVLV